MEITEIKQQLTIDQVLSHYHLKPDRNNMLHCPFHDDKTPSLQIYPKTNTFCCFSSNCSAGTGDVIDFIQLKERCNKHEALMKAKELTGFKNGAPAKTKPHNTGAAPLTRTALLTRLFTYFRNGLTGSKQAREYLAGRNLDKDRLQVGYNSGQFHYMDRFDGNENHREALIASFLQVGMLQDAGMMGKNGDKMYRPFGKGCITFPLKDRQNQITGLYFRSTINENNIHRSKHFYLKDRQGLYPQYPDPSTKTLILTESIIDCASLQQLNLKGYELLALYGTNGLTGEHSKAIKELRDLEEIIIFLDGDAAGRKATEKLQTILQELCPELKISAVETPEGEDINSLAVSHPGEEAELFKHLIDQRITLSSETKPQSTGPATGKLNTTNPELLHYTTDNLDITILGGIKITGLDRLRVTLKIDAITAGQRLPIRHSLDLYNSKQVGDLVQQVSDRYELGQQEVQHTLAALTGALEDYRHTRLEAMKPKKPEKKTLTPEEQKAALDYLKDPQLMLKTLKDITKSGIIGEERNAMIAYLTYMSRKREKPLHIMCLGASGSGKTYLQEKIGELIPEEDKLEITMLSENAFYYFGQEELKHKLILIEDLDGAENVLYPLRELQSKRRISKTVTLKDNKGNLKTATLKVEGPVCVSSCTTREKVYEDNANRCILLYIDTGKEQDRRITAYQRNASAGLINTTAENEIKAQFKNIQRLLRPVKVINPYAQYIDLPEEVFKPRRTMILLLSFIETITFYHQYQREVKTDPETLERYIESTTEDVEKGFNLLRDVLFSKSDELTGACRSFFEDLKQHLRSTDKQSFIAREIRKVFRMNPNNLKYYLSQLQRYGLIKVTGGNRYRGLEYEISNYDDYKALTGQIDQVLNATLEKIKRVGK